MEYQTGKVHSKFQVPNMFAVHMKVPFVKYQYRDLKVLRILYLQENPDLKKSQPRLGMIFFMLIFTSLTSLTSQQAL